MQQKHPRRNPLQIAHGKSPHGGKQSPNGKIFQPEADPAMREKCEESGIYSNLLMKDEVK